MRTKQTARKSFHPYISTRPMHRSPHPPFNALHFLLQLDEAGMSTVLQPILRALDTDSWKALKLTCRKARDLIRGSVTSVSIDLHPPSCTSLACRTFSAEPIKLPRKDLSATHTHVTHLNLIFNTPAALKSITSGWKTFLSRLSKLTLTTRLPWEAKCIIDLRNFLSSCHSLKDLTLTVSLTFPTFILYSFTAHLTSDTGPLENLDQLLPCPPGRVTPAKLAAIRDIPGGFLAAPLFRDNLVEIVADVYTHKEIWDALKAAAAASNKPVQLKVKGGRVKHYKLAANVPPLGPNAWSVQPASLIAGTKQLSSLSVRMDGDFFQPIIGALLPPNCSQLRELTWAYATVAYLPKPGSLPKLTNLNLPEFKEPRGLAAAVSHFSSLQQLSFSVKGDHSAFASSLPHFSSLTCLSSLSITYKAQFGHDHLSSPTSSADASSSRRAGPSSLTLPALQRLNVQLGSLSTEQFYQTAEIENINICVAFETFLACLTAPQLTEVTGVNLPARSFGQFAARHPLLQLPHPLNLKGSFQWATYRQASLRLAVQGGAEFVDVARSYPHLIPFTTNTQHGVTEAVVKEAAGAANTRLEYLMLGRNIRMGEDALDHIADKCPNLRALQLCNVRNLAARGMRAIAEKLHDLRILSLQGCGMTLDDSAFMTLAAGCPKLQYLRLAGLATVGEEGVRHLAQMPAPDKLLTVRIPRQVEKGVPYNLSTKCCRILTEAGWTVTTEFDVIED